MKNILLIVVLALSPQVFANSAVDQLLKTFVAEGGVRYEALCSTGQTALAEAVAEIAAYTEAEFAYATNEDQISFLINAYNLYTLKSICDNFPVESIRDIPGVWKKVKHPVIGRELTLDHIEHEMLRKLYDEPRIHMALVCASKDCPSLLNEAYTADKLDEQLNSQSKKFLARNRALRVDIKKGKVSLSALFDWFGNDFTHEPGPALENLSGKHRGVMRFVIQHAPVEHKSFLTAGDYKIKHIPYDWKLNSAPTK